MEHTALAAWRRLGLTEDEPEELSELELVAQQMAETPWRSIDDAREALAALILQERGVQPGRGLIG